MITGMHVLIYADDADAARSFFRDVLDWPYVDAHGGWLIFRAGPAELGVHPTSGADTGEQWAASQHHEISLMCDDIEDTVADLQSKGAQFAGPIQDSGFGRTASMEVPGAGVILLYEPRHPVAYNL
jgi:predicted enzyme related to lactoylglutathione lyase